MTLLEFEDALKDLEVTILTQEPLSKSFFPKPRILGSTHIIPILTSLHLSKTILAFFFQHFLAKNILKNPSFFHDPALSFIVARKLVGERKLGEEVKKSVNHLIKI